LSVTKFELCANLFSMKAILPMAAFLLFQGISFLNAQGVLIGWDFPLNSTVDSVTSAITATGVVGQKSFAMASDLSPNVFESDPYAWGASNWTPDGTLPGPNATTNNDYFSFEIEAVTGKKVTISGISRLILQVSQSGPKKWSLLYSENNSNPAFDPSPIRNYGPFNVVNPANPSEILDTDITALVNAAIAANPITLTAGKIGYFRLVGFGGTGTSGSGRIVANAPAGTSDFALTGTVQDIVPSDYLTAGYPVSTTYGIPYRVVNDYRGVSTTLAFDLYRPTIAPTLVLPVVILIHGGGYNASSADRTQSYIVSLANQLAARGFQAMSIDYRLRASADRTTDATQLPALRDAAADTLEAVKFVRANAAAYGWDPNAIFLLGGSAGGRIAAWLAVRESGDQGGLSTSDLMSTTSPASSVTSDATAVYDRSGMVASAVLFGGPETSFRAYTVNSSDLPCIMIHGTYDGNTIQTGSIDTYGSVDLYNQLIAVGVPSELHLLNGYGHQFDTRSGAYASVDAIPTVADLTVRFFIKQWERKLAGGTETFSPIVSKAGGSGLTLTAPLTTKSAAGTTYQWTKNGMNLVGKTSATLVLNPLSASDNGSYSVAVGNPDQSWVYTDVSSLSFINTPISAVNYISTGLNEVLSHPTSMTLSVATVNVPSLAVAYPGESATSDVDGDGWVALVEYALGWSRAQGSVGKSAIFPQTVVENQRLVLNYQMRTNDPKVEVTAETSSDLGNPLGWSSTGVSVSAVGSVTIGGEVLEKRSASVPMDVATRFLRLRVLQNP
jgi:acetyl esterase/lipase